MARPDESEQAIAEEGEAAAAGSTGASEQTDMISEVLEAGASSKCVYHGPFPPDHNLKNYPLGSVDDKGNCTFTHNGQTYIEGQGPVSKPHKGNEHPGAREGKTGSPNDIDVHFPSGNEKEWTEEEMANAKPMPLPVVQIEGRPATPAEDRRPGQEGRPMITIWALNDDQRKLIDAHLAKAGLNEYGDPKGTEYDCNPLYDEKTDHTSNRYDYILNKGVDIPGIDKNKLTRASY